MSYSSILSVSAAATDLTLLTVDELRSVAGASDESKDPLLKRLGSRVADRIVRTCRVRADGKTPPTLREETLIETFRRDWSGSWLQHSDRRREQQLILGRRPIVSMTSVVEDGTTLVEDTDYVALTGSGILQRLANDNISSWRATKIVVTYKAGWATVPEGLKRAAEELLRIYFYREGQDPALRQISIPGVVERQFWVGAGNDQDVPDNVLEMLAPYRNEFLG